MTLNSGVVLPVYDGLGSAGKKYRPARKDVLSLESGLDTERQASIGAAIARLEL